MKPLELIKIEAIQKYPCFNTVIYMYKYLVLLFFDSVF